MKFLSCLTALVLLFAVFSLFAKTIHCPTCNSNFDSSEIHSCGGRNVSKAVMLQRVHAINASGHIYNHEYLLSVYRAAHQQYSGSPVSGSSSIKSAVSKSRINSLHRHSKFYKN